MSNPEDLRRILQGAPSPGSPLSPTGSGYTINMPDGKGGQAPVPVEIATCLLLDNIASTLGELVKILSVEKPPQVVVNNARQPTMPWRTKREAQDLVESHLDPETGELADE